MDFLEKLRKDRDLADLLWDGRMAGMNLEGLYVRGGIPEQGEHPGGF